MPNDVRDLTGEEMQYVLGGSRVRGAQRASDIKEEENGGGGGGRSGGLGNVNVGISGVLGAGAVLTGTFMLVPGPHTPIAGGITAVLGGAALVTGWMGL
ncbi:hypothetical protein BXY39_1857 [Eilatimonas milleporae]|uniref:Uncharacterized protein n=2 Tax=Eilatimonas milleporae TaxID=911205 RepID=A0A3M0CDE4_9PROT|nr:hypothetical protein BXY39_1857 [Eilatimonas milleporae]